MAAAIALVLGQNTAASATPILMLRQDGHTIVANEPWLPARSFTPVTVSATGADSVSKRQIDRNVRTELTRLSRSHRISHADYTTDLASFNRALNTEKRLRGTRAVELEAVIENLHDIAATGQLTPSRLPVLFLTLDRNRRWWSTGALLASGQRVAFAGSQLVWEYYPGQGIQLQELGSWGQADWMYRAGPHFWPRLRRLVDELIPLGVRRGGGIAWEYYFHFDGGLPPWTSAMSQATALQALTQTWETTHQTSYLALARQAIPVLRDAPPTGTSVTTHRGRRFLLYSFAPQPDVAVINGFLQTLIGLYDYAKATNDQTGWSLFRAGDAEARAELPQYDTGAWSLYQPGQESTLDYHKLVTDFLEQLCARTQATEYCTTARRFHADLTTPPTLALLTSHLRAHVAADIYFRVSKVSRVGITIRRNGRTVFLTSATFPYRTHTFSIPAALSLPGAYTVTLDATDLAGNYAAITRTLHVSSA